MVKQVYISTFLVMTQFNHHSHPGLLIAYSYGLRRAVPMDGAA